MPVPRTRNAHLPASNRSLDSCVRPWSFDQYRQDRQALAASLETPVTTSRRVASPNDAWATVSRAFTTGPIDPMTGYALTVFSASMRSSSPS